MLGLFSVPREEKLATTPGYAPATATLVLARFVLQLQGVESIWFGSASDVGALLAGSGS